MTAGRTFPRDLALALFLVAPLVGCMSMSGLSGKSEYACQAPEGVACDSVSGTYANAVHGSLPSQRRSKRGATPPPPVTPARAGPTTATAPPLATPLRSAPRFLRLWFKPWEDADQDLYDQGYVYVQIDNGQWLIEHAHRAIRDQYAPLRPPPTSPATDAGSDRLPREPPPYPPIDLPAGDPR